MPSLSDTPLTVPRPALPRLTVPQTPTRPVPQMEGEAAELLNALRAWVVPQGAVSPAAIDLLGPDLFGTLELSPPPRFLANLPYELLSTDQLYSLFSVLDMANPDAQLISYEWLPDDFPHYRETVWQDERAPGPESGGRDRRAWAPRGADLPDHLLRLPDVIELPLMVHAIWLGGPLGGTAQTEEFRRNIAAFARATGPYGFRTNLFTDVPREDFLAAAQPLEPRNSDEAENDRLDAVRDMLEWAREHEIRLINIREVFHSRVGLPAAQRFLLAELNKQHGRGYAAASDLVRVLVLALFGGWYTDGDNVLSARVQMGIDGISVPAWLDEVSGLFYGDGYAVHGSRNARGVNNSSLLAVRDHPFIWLYLEQIEENYEKTQYALLGDSGVTERGRAEMWVRSELMRPRRHSVMSRTGPDNLQLLAEQLGYPRAFPDMPHLTEVTMGAANSWLSRGPFERYRSYLPGEAAEVLARVTATLIRQLHNRPGDLHLTTVAPAVNGLPDPAAAWESVVEFILEQPELAGQIRTVTDRVMVPPDNPGGPVEVAVLDLPPVVRQRLGLTDPAAGEDPPGTWLLAELSRPVAIAPRTPQAPTHSANTPRRPRFFGGSLLSPDTAPQEGSTTSARSSTPAVLPAPSKSPLIRSSDLSARWSASRASGPGEFGYSGSVWPWADVSTSVESRRQEFAARMRGDLIQRGYQSQDFRRHLVALEEAMRWWQASGSSSPIDRLFGGVAHLDALLGLGVTRDRESLLPSEAASRVLVGAHIVRDGDLAALTPHQLDRADVAADELAALLRRLGGLRNPSSEASDLIRQVRVHTNVLMSTLRPSRPQDGGTGTLSPTSDGLSGGASVRAGDAGGSGFRSSGNAPGGSAGQSSAGGGSQTVFMVDTTQIMKAGLDAAIRDGEARGSDAGRAIKETELLRQQRDTYDAAGGGRQAASDPAAGAELPIGGPPESIQALVDHAEAAVKRLGISGVQVLEHFVDRLLGEVRYKGQPETEYGMPVSEWFAQALDGQADGLVRPRPGKAAVDFLYEAGEGGFVVGLPDGRHAPSVLALGEDGQVWHISFTADEPVASPLPAGATLPYEQVLIFNRCKQFVLPLDPVRP